MPLRYRVAFIFFIAILHFSYAQEARVSGTFTNVTFPKFIEQVEAQTPYRFFYNPQAADSLVVTASPQGQPVEDLLNQIFTGTDFRFAIDGDNNIFITHEREILTALPDDFFGTGTNQTNRPVLAFDYSLYEKREKQRK